MTERPGFGALRAAGLLVGLAALLAAAGPGPGLSASGAGAEDPTQEARRLDRLEDAREGMALPPGWEIRSVSGEAPPTTRIGVSGDGRPELRMEAAAAAGQAWLELAETLEPGTGTLSWTWRVDARPDGVDLRDPDRDDAPARLFVVFGDRGLLSSPRFLFYTWGGPEAVGEIFLSHVGDEVGVVVVRNGDDPAGRWLAERRDLAADFRAAFGADAAMEPVTAVGLMADTDSTGDTARVRLREIRWVPAREAGEPDP